MTVRPAMLLCTAAIALWPGAAGAAAADVLVVGDSLEVGTGPHLKRELAGREVEVHARTGRPSPEGLAVLRARLRPGHRVVVFDLGTNDEPSRPGVLRASLSGALSVAGDRCLVISTVRRPPLNGVPVDGLNAEIERLRAEPNVIVADWRGLTEERPALMAPDRVHATPQGYVQRAALVANAVEQCGDREEVAPAPRPARPKRPVRPPPPPRISLDFGVVDALIGNAVGLASDALAAAAAVVLGPPPEPVLGSPPP